MFNLTQREMGYDHNFMRLIVRQGIAASSLGTRLSRPMEFRHPNLLRTLDRAHEGSVFGVLADGLVSWGNDGAIRFWSLAGELRPGGDPRAQHGAAGRSTRH